MKHDWKESQEIKARKKGYHNQNEPRIALELKKKAEKQRRKIAQKTATVLIANLCQIEGIKSTSIEGKLKEIWSTQLSNQL